jgi:hypothetical protein
MSKTDDRLTARFVTAIGRISRGEKILSRFLADIEKVEPPDVNAMPSEQVSRWFLKETDRRLQGLAGILPELANAGDMGVRIGLPMAVRLGSGNGIVNVDDGKLPFFSYADLRHGRGMRRIIGMAQAANVECEVMAAHGNVQDGDEISTSLPLAFEMGSRRTYDALLVIVDPRDGFKRGHVPAQLKKENQGGRLFSIPQKKTG